MRNTKSLITKRLITLTLMLVVMAALARFAEYHWLFDLLTHLTWHTFLLGLVLTALLLGLKNPGWAALALGLSIHQFTLINQNQGAAATACTNEKEGEVLRILQFNIGSRNEKVAAIYSWLKKQRSLPDIIVLFEATEKLDEYINKMEVSGWPHILTEYRADNYGVAVVSAVKNASLRLEAIGDPYLPHIVVKGTTDKRKIPFTLVATHPPPPLTGKLTEIRNKQFVALADWLLQDQVPNQIVVGDLNITPWSPWFNRLLDDAKLRNAQSEKGYAGTFPTYGLPSIFAIPIDHTLVSPNVKVLARTAGPGFTLGSDHRLVETRLWMSSCEKPI